MKTPARQLTRGEAAAMRRALDLANLTLAHLACMALALRGAKPETLRREIKRLQAMLKL